MTDIHERDYRQIVYTTVLRHISLCGTISENFARRTRQLYGITLTLF